MSFASIVTLTFMRAYIIAPDVNASLVKRTLWKAKCETELTAIPHNMTTAQLMEVSKRILSSALQPAHPNGMKILGTALLAIESRIARFTEGLTY